MTLAQLRKASQPLTKLQQLVPVDLLGGWPLNVTHVPFLSHSRVTQSRCVSMKVHLEVGVGVTSSCQEKREFSAVLGDGTAMDTISLVLSVDSPPCGIVEFCCACVCFLLKWLLEGLLRLTNSISFCCGLVALLQMSNYSFVSQNHSWDLRFISSQLLSADRLKKR